MMTNYYYDLPDDLKDKIGFEIHKSLIKNVFKEIGYYNKIFDTIEDEYSGCEGSDWLRTVEYMICIKLDKKFRKKDMSFEDWYKSDDCGDEELDVLLSGCESSLYKDAGIQRLQDEVTDGLIAIIRDNIYI